MEETLYPALLKRLKSEYLEGEPYRELKGANTLDDVVMVDQSPIGRSPRSNPVTYLKAFDEIRKAFAATHEAKAAELRSKPVQLQCGRRTMQYLRGKWIPHY